MPWVLLPRVDVTDVGVDCTWNGFSALEVLFRPGAGSGRFVVWMYPTLDLWPCSFVPSCLGDSCRYFPCSWRYPGTGMDASYRLTGHSTRNLERLLGRSYVPTATYRFNLDGYLCLRLYS